MANVNNIWIWKDFVYNGRHYQVEYSDQFLNSGRCRVILFDLDGSIHSSFVHASDCTPEKLESHFIKLLKEFTTK